MILTLVDPPQAAHTLVAVKAIGEVAHLKANLPADLEAASLAAVIAQQVNPANQCARQRPKRLKWKLKQLNLFIKRRLKSLGKSTRNHHQVTGRWQSQKSRAKVKRRIITQIGLRPWRTNLRSAILLLYIVPQKMNERTYHQLSPPKNYRISQQRTRFRNKNLWVLSKANLRSFIDPRLSLTQNKRVMKPLSRAIKKWIVMKNTTIEPHQCPVTTGGC